MGREFQLDNSNDHKQTLQPQPQRGGEAWANLIPTVDHGVRRWAGGRKGAINRCPSMFSYLHMYKQEIISILSICIHKYSCSCSTCTFTFTRTCTRTLTYTRSRTHTNIHTHTHTSTDTHCTCSYTHSHTRVHTNIQMPLPACQKHACSSASSIASCSWGTTLRKPWIWFWTPSPYHGGGSPWPPAALHICRNTYLHTWKKTWMRRSTYLWACTVYTRS